MKKFDYLRPKTLEDIFPILYQMGEKATIIAGGTDVMVMIKKKTISPELLISLKGIPGLDRIEAGDPLRIGPLVTHRQVEKCDLIRKRFHALSDAADVLGSIQIRNVATVAGNICTAAPSADTAPPLLALGAQVRLRSDRSERTVPVERFFVGPGKTIREREEIVTEILIPNPPPHTASAYWKHQRRQALDLPVIGVAVLLSLDRSPIRCRTLFAEASSLSSILRSLEREEIVCQEVRIGLGVAGPTPIRALSAEAVLRGKTLGVELVEAAADTAAQEAQVRDSLRGEAWYRREMIRVHVKRMVLRSVERIVDPDKTAFPSRPW